MDQKIKAFSTGGLIPHKHFVELSIETIQNPPSSGITLKTNKAYALVYKHDHGVHLSQQDLLKIKNGETVVVKDTDKGRHEFTFSLRA